MLGICRAEFDHHVIHRRSHIDQIRQRINDPLEFLLRHRPRLLSHAIHSMRRQCDALYLSTPPVAFATAATTLAQAASISASVNVRSRGWKVTSMASDFLPASILSPS